MKYLVFIFFGLISLNPNDAMAARFSPYGDGTARDNFTGLMWQREDDNVLRNWQAALAYCEALSLAGYYDWRLPNIKELHSIVDDTYSPTINGAIFSGTNSAFYWSGSTHAYESYNAWVVLFSGGGVYGGGSTNYAKSQTYYVRCVR